MLFNSINFAIFLPVVFILYWVLSKKLKSQNILLLVCSYFFYACWDWRFLFLLIFSTLLDYFTGTRIAATSDQRIKKIWFWISISVNLGLLGLFKYYNFFAASFAEALSNAGLQVNPFTLNMVLPVGISFYTFHGVSYIIDIYKGRIKAEKEFINYAVFVSFFPLLVAGPIERATHLLPQLQKTRTFDTAQATDGLKQILWGLFKKVVIADQCADYVNLIFNDPAGHSGSTILLAAVLFAFQIYGDFSGYADIAIGTAKLFGITLLRNFAFPYFSRDIAEFWRRWHISLSSWFRDYLYIPLGGSKCATLVKLRNIVIIFLVSGLWHGANWTFIVWGLLNALFIMPSIIFNTHKNNIAIVAAGRYLPTIKEAFSIVLTFSLTVLGWIFFRSATVSQAFHFMGGIFNTSLFYVPELMNNNVKTILFLLVIFIISEWLGREAEFAIAKLDTRFPKAVRWGFYYLIMMAILYFSGSGKQFIYFQF